MRLGIDFGTTRTVISAVQDGRHPVVTFDDSDGYTSWLRGSAAWDAGQLCFGDAAAQLLAEGAPGIRSIKRAVSPLAPHTPIAIEGAPATSALELLTAYLTWVRERLLRDSNLPSSDTEPLEAMVAVPAHASSRQRFTTMEAFRAAGFEVLGMINEPTAAAIEYAYRDRKVLSPRSPKRYLVVYDLGGGTFDTSAVSLEGRRFELLTSQGLAQLGGDDFDAVLLANAAEVWGTEVPARQRPALLERIREAKETLTPRSRRLLVDPAPVLDVEPAILDTTAIYQACAPLVAQTLSMMDDVFSNLAGRGLEPDARALGAVYLVGGGAAFPAVARALRERYGRKVQIAPEPHASTAVGLAVAADPEADVLVREASTRFIGVWREARSGHEPLFDPLLSKDTLPDDGALVVQRRYRPEHTIGHLRFLECTALDRQGQPDGEVTPFAELRFPYDPALTEQGDLSSARVERTDRLRHHEIVETYTYDASGSVLVSIENLSTHFRRELTLGALR